MPANNLQEAGLILTAQGADEFKSAMKGISAATKEAYSELKLAQSQYDKNTSATEKLADQQKYLQKMTEEYTKKEQILRAELAQMENAEERDEAAIAKKKAEINNCKASLNKYEDALKDVTKQIEAEGMGRQAQGCGRQDAEPRRHADKIRDRTDHGRGRCVSSGMERGR